MKEVKKQQSFTLDKSVVDSLEQKANAENRSKSNFLNTLLSTIFGLDKTKEDNKD